MDVKKENNLDCRYIFPDVIKAFLIYLVILGHVLGLYYKGNMELYWKNPIVTFIYSFHMPLFIAISAFFLGISKGTSLSLFLKKKIRRLFSPILGGLVLCIFFDILFGIYPCNSKLFLLKIYNYLTIYWFFNCLLILSVIISVFMSLRRIYIIGLIITNVILVAFYDYIPGIVIKSWQIIRLMPIFMLTYIIGVNQKKMKNVFLNYFWQLLLISSVFWMVLIFICGVDLIKYSCFTRILVGIFSSISMTCIFYWLYSKFSQNVNLLLTRIGRNSLGIYLFHVPIFKSLPKIENFFVIILLSLCILLVSSVLTDLCRKNKVGRILLGENK